MFVGCAVRDVRKELPATHIPQTSDTLYTEEAALMIYGTDPDRALTIIDSALIVGNLDSYNAQFLRAFVYAKSVTRPRPDEAIALCNELLRQDSAQAVTRSRANNRSDLLQVMMQAYRHKRDDEQWLKYAIECAQLSREWGDETDALRTEADIAVVLTHLGRKEEGMAKLDATIRALESGAPSVDRMDAAILATKRKITILEESDRFADMIAPAQQILDKIADYRTRPSAYAEDSYRLPPIPEDRERYCRFCQAQAWGFMARAYAQMTPPDMARLKKYTALFEQSDYAQTFGGRKMIVPAWKALGRWDDVLAVDDEFTDRMGGDTLNANYALILKDRADAASYRGDHAQALAWMARYSSLERQLHQQAQSNQAQEYAARYRADEQERKIQDVEAQSARKSTIIWVITLLLVLSVCAASFIPIRRRIKKIAEKKEPDAASASVTAPATPDPQLFQLIDKTIREERLYASDTLQRQDILDRFKISRRTLSDLLAAYADGKSFPIYINEIRLQEAVVLLRENPEMSITEIAEAVGLTLPTLRNQFKRQYGVTPTEYRAQRL